jgi:outer membrane protein OmpA-like peptidoglycan-associated protein
LCIASGLTVSGARADEAPVSHEQIERALESGGATRGIRLKARTPVAAEKSSAELDHPAIDLPIPFEFDSSELEPTAVAQLKQLATALNSSTLTGARFLIAGHTDGRGGATYNRSLSLRRAESVKRFLVGSGVNADRLQTAGRGMDQLLTPDRPLDPSNRRVEIRNLSGS